MKSTCRLKRIVNLTRIMWHVAPVSPFPNRQLFSGFPAAGWRYDSAEKDIGGDHVPLVVADSDFLRTVGVNVFMSRSMSPQACGSLVSQGVQVSSSDGISSTFLRTFASSAAAVYFAAHGVCLGPPP